MHSENIIYKNEMNEKTTKFLDKFSRCLPDRSAAFFFTKCQKSDLR